MSRALAGSGISIERFKTGTPCRLSATSIDFAQLAVQPGDAEPQPFSFLTDRISQEQMVCWITRTTPEIHDLIRANLHRAPMYTANATCGEDPQAGPVRDEERGRDRGGAGPAGSGVGRQVAEVELADTGSGGQRLSSAGDSPTPSSPESRPIVAGTARCERTTASMRPATSRPGRRKAVGDVHRSRCSYRRWAC